MTPLSRFLLLITLIQCCNFSATRERNQIRTNLFLYNHFGESKHEKYHSKSRNGSFTEYINRLIRANTNLSSEKKCPESCVNGSVVDPSGDCKEQDNWFTSTDNNWDYDTGSRVGYAIFYLVFLLYLFVGVSIASDRFMAGIEVITAQVSTKSQLFKEFQCPYKNIKVNAIQ